jgi:hypothetical protein
MARLAASVLSVVFLVCPKVVLAQARVTADLQGSVFDESGAALAGASVSVTSSETNLRRTTQSDTKGHYAVMALAPGKYQIAAELTGFAAQTRDAVVLQLGQTATIDFKLGIAGTQEQLTVTAEAPMVDFSQTAVASVVGQQQIDSLPINGRNFISFSVITAGVTTDRTPQQGASATSGLSFAGQRARSNNIMVDGLDNNDAAVGSVRATFSQEAIREFQVLTNGYSAEYGKAAGGVVNIVTKSGTNEWHGNGFFFFRDEALNAKDHFEKFDVFDNPVNRDKAPYSQKQYGATLGGPIKKDRTFFFLSLERADIAANNFVNIDPTAAAVIRSAGFPVELGNVPWDFKSTELMAKLDHHWSADHGLVFRGSFADTTNENIEPFGGLVARSRGAVQLRKDWSLAAALTDVFGGKWLNEARIQFARGDQKINSLDPLCNGSCDLETEGGPTLEITGVASVGRQRFTPQPRKNNRLQITDAVSYFAGSHGLKAGLEFNTIDNDAALPLHYGGRYIFSALPAIPGVLPAPITAIQAVALGLPAAYVQGYGLSSGPYGYKDLSLFVQDEWRVTKRLTLKPGLRYQRQFWDKVQNDVSTVGGARFAYTFPQDGNDFAPRIAASFDLTGDRKTELRAAYGIFFDNQITAISGITNILDGTSAGTRTLVLPFPSSIAAWRAPGHKIPEPTTPFPSLVISIDPGLETPYAHQASLGVDRSLGKDLSLSVSLLSVRGKKQIGTVDYNPVVRALGAGRRPNDVAGRAGTSASVLQYTSFGDTWYKGLTLSLSKRFSHDYQFLLSYTLSKAEDNSTDFQSAFIPENNGLGRDPGNPTGLPVGFNPASERGPATHDQRHRFVLSGLYQLPWSVQLSTIITAASGRPFTPLAGADLNGDGNGGAFPPDRARVNPADPATSVGRNSETLAKQINVDLRVSKRFKASGRVTVDAIVEAFNLLDRANFSEINNIFGAGAFPGSPLKDAQGRVTYGRFEQALPPRQMQLALKVGF